MSLPKSAKSLGDRRARFSASDVQPLRLAAGSFSQNTWASVTVWS